MAKVKVKTHSGAKKRFKITGTGKIKYDTSNKRERTTHKESKRKRIARTAGVAGSANAPTIKKLVPYM